MSSRSLDARIEAASALLRIGQPAARPLLAAKKTMDFDAQTRAEQTLVRMGPAAVGALVEQAHYEYTGRKGSRPGPYPLYAAQDR